MLRQEAHWDCFSLFAFRLGTNTEKAKVTTPLSTMLETSFTALGIYCLERVREGRRTPPN
jgi:hypothetical protein